MAFDFKNEEIHNIRQNQRRTFFVVGVKLFTLKACFINDI